MPRPIPLLALVLVLALPARPGRADEPGGAFVLRPGAAWQPPPSPMVLRSRLTRIIEDEQRRHRPRPDDAVFAPSCIRAPTLSDFFNLAEVTGKARAPAAEKGRLPDLRRPSLKIHELFTVLRHTRWGTAVLNKFMPRFGFDIRIEHYSDAMRAEEQGRGRNAAAVYDIDRKTIYVDRMAPIGTVAPILLHEIVHSLDNDFARSIEREHQILAEFDDRVARILQFVAARARKKETELERADFRPEELDGLRREKDELDQYRDVRTYRAERVAYDMYSQIVAELAVLSPGYYAGVTSGTVPLFSDEELIATERLNPDVIARYRRGLCRTRH